MKGAGGPPLYLSVPRSEKGLSARCPGDLLQEGTSHHTPSIPCRSTISCVSLSPWTRGLRAQEPP